MRFQDLNPSLSPFTEFRGRHYMLTIVGQITDSRKQLVQIYRTFTTCAIVCEILGAATDARTRVEVAINRLTTL